MPTGAFAGDVRLGEQMEPLHDTDPEAIGPYRLFARLGAGGMGDVFLARSAGGRTVAVKAVRSELARDAVFRTRFRREVAAARAVDAVHTAPVTDADPDGPTPWLATAYVLGPSLAQAVREHGPLPEDSVRTLGARLAEALEAIHRAGLVHRDLKPSNVLLAADGPRVIDFGIARALDDDEMTRTGGVIGSPGFMSPEQAGGLPSGAPGDVFSLGSVLVFAVTGHGPFESASGAAAQLYKVVHEEPDLAGVPAELRGILAQCLRKDPERRPRPAELRALLAVGAADGEWLPGPVAADLARHAAAVMNLEAPLRVGPGPSEAPTIAQNRTRVDLTGPVEPAPAAAVTSAPEDEAAPRRGAFSRRRLLLSGGALAVTAAAGAATWALTRSDSPGGGAGTAPKPVWTVTTEGSASAAGPALAVVDDLVLVHADTLLAVAAATGEGRWERQDAASRAYLVGGGRLYELSDGLRRLALANGSVGVAASTVLDGGMRPVYQSLVAATDQRLYLKIAVGEAGGEGATTGILGLGRELSSRVWFQEDPDSSDLETPGAIGGSTLLHLDNKYDLVARNTDDGAALWRVETGSAKPRPVRCDDQRAYCAVDDAALQAVGLEDGRQLWRLDPKEGRIGDLAVADGTLYLGLGTRSCSAVDAGTGKVRWTCPLPGYPAASEAPVVAGGTVLVSGRVPHESRLLPCVHAVDAATGRLTWTFTDPTYQPSEESVSCRLSTDGKLVFAWIGNTVSALPLA
ncbi:protein kinase [Kitasatospora sp. NPDC093550]|uniref:protein kinase domain-containing protein n=1 Tax=Kitasatospora sp. NPDC093550 TaxID=3364089 RepID=UPI003803AFF2